jgi:hypothetical protein
MGPVDAYVNTKYPLQSPMEEEEEEDLFVFNDTIEGPRAPAVEPGRAERARDGVFHADPLSQGRAAAARQSCARRARLLISRAFFSFFPCNHFINK